jgi:hypothetical protein
MSDIQRGADFLILCRFLLAKVHMDSLTSKTNRRQIRDALESLPAEVDVYDETMKRITQQDEHDASLAERVLSWIVYSQRPLSLTELRHALAVSSEMTAMDLDAIDDEYSLTSVCAGLVVVDDNSRIIRLVRK